jgi:hypothetical protein
MVGPNIGAWLALHEVPGSPAHRDLPGREGEDE